MDDGKELWTIWQSWLKSYGPLFRRGGWVRFAQWVTAMVQCGEEHTITQSLTALEMSAAQVVTVVAARYRQEDGFRDHKQRLGMEECRAWTKEPILRTFQIQGIAMTLLRLTQFRLDEVWGEETWWHRPEWNRRKNHPSILDLRRLFRDHRERFSEFLVDLEEFAKPPQACFLTKKPGARAA